MADVYIGLGANIGEPANKMRLAIDRIEGTVRVAAVSSLYRSEPVGLRDQPDFRNAVVGGSTDVPPDELLAVLVAIEGQLGRTREVPMGPRTIDLDLLLYGDRVLDGPGLQVPHPGLAERRFVLEPLVEIAPNLVHPVSGVTVSDLLGRLGPVPCVERVEGPSWRRPI